VSNNDGGIKVKLGMSVMAYSHNDSYGKWATLVGLVVPELRKDDKYIVVAYSNGNVQRVAKVERVDSDGNETWPIKKSELVEAVNAATHAVKISDLQRTEVVPSIMEDKPRPDNKPTQIEAYQITDGRLFDNKDEADRMQLRIDFYNWSKGVVDPEFKGLRSKLLDFLIDNKTDVSAFLRRVKKVKQ